MAERERLPHWIKCAREGGLPDVHQQCSHSLPEVIEQNQLVCALGQDVATCPILTSWFATADEYREGFSGFYREAMEGDGRYQVAADICSWHVYTSVLGGASIDTSEGYVKDEGDRRFWSNVYASLRRDDDVR